MSFRPGNIVKVLASDDVDERLHGRVGVVDTVDDDDEPELGEYNIDIILIDGNGEEEQSSGYREQDLIACDTDDAMLLVKSYTISRFWDMFNARHCKHEHIERTDNDALKCIDCGLKTSDMHYDIAIVVDAAWQKRLVP